jgi:hypothetical protein
MVRLSILFVLFIIPLTLQAQVYRCDTSEGTIYSQMPCSENAERLSEYDPESASAAVEAGAVTIVGSEVSETPTTEKTSSPMDSFISTLEKQREQQFSTLDANIKSLETQLSANGEEAPDEETRTALERQLADFNSQRASISDQYASLITEASTRASSGLSSQ